MPGAAGLDLADRPAPGPPQCLRRRAGPQPGETRRVPYRHFLTRTREQRWQICGYASRSPALKAEAAESDEHGLKRTLTATNLVMLGIGAVIGAGFFVLTGHAAAENAGPAISLSFVLGGIVCAFAGLCYAEMASTVPIAGSAYTYAYATMGEFIAWLIGWDLILEYMVGATTVAIGWSGYVTSFLHDWGINIPAQFTQSPGTKLIEIPNEIADKLHMRHGWSILGRGAGAARPRTRSISRAFSQVTAIINVPAMVIVALVTALLVVGIQESARVNNVIVAIKVTIVVLFILLGLPFVSTDNWGGPFIPPSEGPWYDFQYGWSGIFRGAGLVFFAYIGFDAVSTAAQEAKNPQRDMPIGIIGSLVICTILYCLAGFVMTGVVNYKQLNVPDPVAVAIDAMNMKWLSGFVKLGAIAGPELGHPRHAPVASRGSSTRWPATGSCPRPSRISIPGSARPGSPRSSPA